MTSKEKAKLRTFLKHCEFNGDLYAVLAALRGPDEPRMMVGDVLMDSILVKEATTCIIRAAVGLKDAYANQDSRASVRIRRKANFIGNSYHFFSHARRAFRALGLKWDSLNKRV